MITTFPGHSFRSSSLGFTLIELVVAMGISIIIGALLISVLSHNTGFFYQESGVVNEGINQNNLTVETGKYIRQAVQVASGYPISSPTYTSSSTTLVLQIPGLSSTGTVLSNIYDYVVVYKDSSNSKVLHLQVFPDPTSYRGSLNEILTTLLNTITFTYLDINGNVVSPTSSAQVEINYSLLSKTGSVSSTGTVDFKTTLRNH